jgi:predicted Zn-dependent protease
METKKFLTLAKNEIQAQKIKLAKNIIKVAQGKKSFASLKKTLYKTYQNNNWYRMLKEAIEEAKQDESKAKDFAFIMFG